MTNDATKPGTFTLTIVGERSVTLDPLLTRKDFDLRSAEMDRMLHEIERRMRA